MRSLPKFTTSWGLPFSSPRDFGHFADVTIRDANCVIVLDVHHPIANAEGLSTEACRSRGRRLRMVLTRAFKASTPHAPLRTAGENLDITTRLYATPSIFRLRTRSDMILREAESGMVALKIRARRYGCPACRADRGQQELDAHPH